MKGLGIRVVVGAAAVLATTGAFAWARWAGTRLYYAGKVVSTRVIVHDGEAYAPVRDLAAALSMTVQPRSDGYAIVGAGGATQVEGLNGKIGDDLFNGEVRLKVIKVVRGSDYKREFSQGGDIIAPTGQDIVAVVMRFKNGTKKAIFPNVTGKNPTALTDEDEHSYEPASFPDGTGRNIDLLPGAAADFALIFNVPSGATPKDLVYTVDSLGVKPATFRISLKEPQKESQ